MQNRTSCQVIVQDAEANCISFAVCSRFLLCYAIDRSVAAVDDVECVNGSADPEAEKGEKNADDELFSATAMQYDGGRLKRAGEFARRIALEKLIIQTGKTIAKIILTICQTRSAMSPILLCEKFSNVTNEKAVSRKLFHETTICLQSSDIQ